MRLRRFLAAAVILSAAGMALADPIADAGLTPEQVRSAVVESIGQGRPAFPAALRQLSVGARAQFVRAAGGFALQYYKTRDFRERYAAWRTAHEPKLDLVTAEEMAERNGRAKADYAKAQVEQQGAAENLEAQRANLKRAGMSDAQVDQLVAQMKQAQQQLAAMQADGQFPNGPPLMTEDERQRENAARRQAYAEASAAFERDHPADPGAPVRRKLEEFLRLSETINFGAKVENGRFADPAYERQSGEWKQLFRAGKPAVDAASDVAREWLKVL